MAADCGGEQSPPPRGVERIEDGIELAPTASEVEADLSLRCGTAHLRPDPPQGERVLDEERGTKV
jgi:hypothetical protein